ncbi:Xaa-Pro peptidase family protein [Agarivorans sp. 1_MG-2023]|uniref:M24 family metallopeptidase n=1 Tax=Agarivorans sp. 1_MG-2023 TaxID=3062634 RepID=UPI0026E3B10E|nr:Xaa-Pro peptidase family protein [Agarivorans sp. 1_MG-2023]MDO6763424.1 Xaa-Pro peptidase family protein [Agarivorans sp. 1_MG-2023]
MTIGVGGSNASEQLALLSNMCSDVEKIGLAEYQQRQTKACRLMQQQGISAIYLNAGTNLYYFTGLKWNASERMVGAILSANGQLHYIAPYFEQDSINDFMLIEAPFHGWHEHQSPYLLFQQVCQQQKLEGKVAIDPSASYFLVDGLIKANPKLQFVNGDSISQACRMQKSANEIALMQKAKDMTMEVQKAAAKILRPGISTSEVTAFIHQAHQKVGASGSSFCIVLFGLASSFPHGVKEPQILQENDWVLIDTGCLVEGYNSDITRTYAFGEATEHQRSAWLSEQKAQLAAFEAAQLGQACANVDAAARQALANDGYGPDYALPGLPHRTGHGCGLDIHEGPYLVAGDNTPLAEGMVFSNEPMLVIPDHFGVRLEDHFYMSANGPVWFTQPSPSVDDPFGYHLS